MFLGRSKTFYGVLNHFLGHSKVFLRTFSNSFRILSLGSFLELFLGRSNSQSWNGSTSFLFYQKYNYASKIYEGSDIWFTCKCLCRHKCKYSLEFVKTTRTYEFDEQHNRPWSTCTYTSKINRCLF
jgi:hypothetical protein